MLDATLPRKVRPTTHSYRGRPPPNRVDYLCAWPLHVVHSYGLHTRFADELFYPAEGKEMISEHTPLWLKLHNF